MTQAGEANAATAGLAERTSRDSITSNWSRRFRFGVLIIRLTF
jgi:hypothetical protein